LLRASDSPIIPDGWARHLGIHDAAPWRSWWQYLARQRATQPDAANTAHLLSLGALHAADHFSFADPDRPWAASPLCSLCGLEAETLAHIFGSCSISQALWNCLSPLPPQPWPSLADLVCPSPILLADIMSARLDFVHATRPGAFGISVATVIRTRSISTLRM
jgi:hypothetical protein